MKESSIQEKDEVQNVRQVQQESQLQFLGGFRLEKGHTIFEINLKTLEIQKAEMEKLPAPFQKPDHRGLHPIVHMHMIGAAPTRVGKIVQKPDCHYIGALNMKNALKKIGVDVKKLKMRKLKPAKP